MKTAFLFLFTTVLNSALLAQGTEKVPSPEVLLDKVIANPGTYSQMCDIQMVARQATPLPIYGLSLDSECQLSVPVLTGLRAKRAEVIPALVKRLGEWDLTRKPETKEMKFKDEKPDEPSEEIADTGLDPKAFNQTLLKIIIDLNATECLPALVKLEKELSQKLEANAADPKQPLPEVQNDAGFTVGDPKTFEPEIKIAGDEPTPEEEAKISAQHNRVAAIVAQRDVLATMLCLLRQERFAPVLKSPFEKAYAASVKEKAKEENFASIKKPSDISKEDGGYVGFDPILKLPTYPGRKSTDVKYNSEVRQSVLDMVKEFQESVPAEKRLGAKGMTEKVYVR